MKQDLVTIKAEALKWCENGFTFYMHEEQFKYRDMSKNQGCNGFTQYGGSVCVPLDTEIKVNATDYTAAVIERIKEFVDGTVIGVTKGGPIEGFFVIAVKTQEFNYPHYTKLDPWPWKENGEWMAKE